MANNFKNNLPLTPLKMEEYLAFALGYDVGFDVLNDIYLNVNRGTDITNKISATKFNDLFSVVELGMNIRATGTNKSLFIASAECSEIASDDFKCVELTFICDSKLITLTLTKFGSTVYLDNKIVKEL